MKSVAVLLLLALGAAIVAADEKVVTLTADKFDDFVKNTPLALIEFYAPWCGHCKALAPEYEKAAQDLEGKNGGVLAKVDCTVEKDICNKYEVQGFPTVKLFRNDGSPPTDYELARKADAIVKFMIKQNAPAVTDLADAAAVKEFAKTESVKVVAFVGASDSVDGYTKAASTLRNEYFFGAVKGNAAANAEFKVTQTPAIVLFRDFDEGNVIHTGDMSAEAITGFIKANSFPLVGVIGPENYAKYLERGFNFVWIFLDMDNAEHTALIKSDVTPVAAEFRDRLSFVQLDGIKWVEHAKSFGLSGNLPGAVLEDRDKRKNFVFPEDKTITKDTFRAHIDGILKGTVSPTIKSEEIPADNSGPVRVIVGKTFDAEVLNNDKDVLVEFYAPWCGHCKSLAPKFEELGKSFASDPTVVIAKIDSTANDSPADIQGFPTLILYPAGDKQHPIPYEGDRTVKAMARFIKANGKAGGRPDKAAQEEADGEPEPEAEDEELGLGDMEPEGDGEGEGEGYGGDDEGSEGGDFDFGEGANMDFDFEGAAADHAGHDHGDHAHGDDHDHGHDDEL